MISKYRDLISVILFFIFSFSLYFNSLGVPFVFDDNHMIIRNNLIKNLPESPSLFTSGRPTSVVVPKGMYRPLLMLTFAFNYFFGRLNPIGYHIINIMFHFFNAVLLFILLRSLLKAFWPAFLASLLFIAHPVNSEAVIYVSCRSTLMSAFFILLGLVAFSKWQRKIYDRRYYLSLVSFLLGLLTKETMIIFPLILISYDLLLRRDAFKNFYIFVRPYLLFILIALIYLLLRVYLIGSVTNLELVRGIYDNILTQLNVSVFYLKLFFFPINLCVGRFFPTAHSVFSPAVMQSFFIITALLSIAIYFIIRAPFLSFAFFWYFLNLLPKFIATLNLVATEHHLYLPAIGIFFAIAIILKKIIDIIHKAKRLIFKIASVIFFVILLSSISILTVKRTNVWKDEYSLWRDNLRQSPLAWPAYNNLGVVATNEGKLDEAEGYFLEALNGIKTIPVPLRVLEVNLHSNLSYIYIVKNKLELAKAEVMKAMAINPSVSEVHNNLGLIYSKQGLLDESIKEFKQAIELDSSSKLAYLNLGISYWDKGDSPLAIETLEKALEIDPDYVVPYIALAFVYEKLGSYKQAISIRLRAIDLIPDDAKNYYYLGLLYGKIGNSKAVEFLNKAIKLDSEFAAAHNNLAITYASLNPPQLELAKKHALLALKYGYKVRPEFLKQLGMEEK